MVADPRYCIEHGWTARAREGFALPSPRPIIDVSSSSSSPARSSSSAHSPVYTPATPPATRQAETQFRTMAARRGAPPFYHSTGEGSNSPAMAAPPGFDSIEPALAAPPPPPAAPWFLGCPTAAAAANARPGLRNFISTGHVPTESGDEARRPPPSGEGEA
ncbi:unnamed protein product [Urochloa humidicola]